MADEILKTGSVLASLMLDLSGIRNGYHKVYCPTCKKQVTHGIELDFFNRVGECMTCDNLRADFIHEAFLEQKEK